VDIWIDNHPRRIEWLISHREGKMGGRLKQLVTVVSLMCLISCEDDPTGDAQPERHDLLVSGTGSGTGAISTSPGDVACSYSGTAASGTCGASFVSGTAVTLTATPAGGHTFAGWSGACAGTGTSTCQVTMDQARSVAATFTPLHPLTVNGGGPGSGSVTSSPGGITCTIAGRSVSGTCSAPYDSGAVVTLTAAPADGHTFSRWAGACTGTGSCQVTMSQARSVTAAFALPTYPLTVTGGGPGSGSVTSTPGGIACTIAGRSVSGTCNAPYAKGTVVTLTAAPADGHTFTGWSGACTGTGSCQVTMSQARTATASFALSTYPLTVTGSGTGRGSVTSSPSGINCTISAGSASGTCSARYTSGAVVTLTAAPISTHTFAGWSGACTGTGSCRVTMSQARTVTAVFRIRQQIAVPAYFDPTSGEWNRLLQEVPPSNIVIINPNNGPGDGYASRISEARSRGARVLGYVYTKYANTRLDSVRNPNGAYDRMIDSVKADVDAYYRLYPNLDGIFLDEVTTECSYAQSYYKPIYDYIRSTYRNATVIVNPGTAVGSCYLEAADIVVTFESSFAEYQNEWSTVDRGWETNARSARIWHIVHTASLSQLNAALELSRRRNAGYVYVTNLTETQNTYGALPPYFAAEADSVTAYGASSP
jgi:Fe-S cluster biogenesis protein NfuA